MNKNVLGKKNKNSYTDSRLFYCVFNLPSIRIFLATLKKDVQAWVKSTTGEYYLGKILFVNDDIVKVEFSDGRQERCLRSEGFKLIPDIVPCPTNLRVGVRVISQFGHRHRFYPGVISSVRRNDSYDILFDDGDCGRGKSYQMRLMQNFPIHRKFLCSRKKRTNMNEHTKQRIQRQCVKE